MGDAHSAGGSAPGPAQAAELSFSYARCRSYAAALALRFDEAFLPTADRRFRDLGLRQEQVEGVVNLYSWTVNHYWKPANYTWRQRLALALHFLLG